MTLGKQFENTYWHDDDGRTNFSLVNKESKEGKPINSSMTGTLDRKFGGDEGKYLSALAEMGRIESTPLQGMLFSPYTGTGLKGDPTVDPDERQKRIRQALGQQLTDKDEADDLVSGTRHERSKEAWADNASYAAEIDGLDPDVAANKSRERHDRSGRQFVDWMDNSDLPMNELRKLADEDFLAVAYPEEAHRGGYYNQSGKLIVVAGNSTPELRAEGKHFPNSRASTLMHEYGHAADFEIHRGRDPLAQQIDRKGVTADPVQEGIADGYADKHQRHAGALESVRRDQHEADNAHQTGYGISHWSDGPSVRSALYAASRFITARRGNSSSIPFKSADVVAPPDPSIGSHPANVQWANERAVHDHQLANIWEHNPDIHDSMERAGMGDIARYVHAKHFDPQASRREAFWSHREPDSEVPVEDRETPPPAKYDEPLPLEGI